MSRTKAPANRQGQPQDKGPAKATMSKGEAERATSVGRGERIKEVLDFDWKLLVRSRAPA